MPLELDATGAVKAETELNRIWRAIERSHKRREKIRADIEKLRTETHAILKRLKTA